MNPLITISIPVKDIHGPRIRNCVKSIELQHFDDYEIIIGDYGSNPENQRKLIESIKETPCSIYHKPNTDVWSLSAARNMGIRRAKGEYAITLDADCILDVNVLSSIVNILKDNENSLITSEVYDLPEMDLNQINLPDSYDVLHKTAKKIRRGRGALIGTTRKWWHKVRGFDERIKIWGGDENDLIKRAKNDGLIIKCLNDMDLERTVVFHQWHQSSKERYIQELGEKEFISYRRANRRIWRKDSTIIRNNESWGL